MQFANETERKTLSKIIEKFDEFAIGEVNETYERYVFNGRNQGQDESIDAYIAALRSLAKTCGFCACLADSLIRAYCILRNETKRNETKRNEMNYHVLK